MGHRLLHEIAHGGCADLHNYSDNKSKCSYLQKSNNCRSKGYINYLHIFYCTCGQLSVLGYALLLLWLLLLFYLLGNTAANYFCYSLESLSTILKLSPTIAGVTLLSLGNGAPDVFASVVSFTQSGDAAVGLNSVLGGAFFVSSAVVGIICMVSAPDHQISLDKPSFLRDVLFLLFSLFSLLLIIIVGKISLLGAISFVSIYFFYVLVVSATHYLYYRKKETISKSSSLDHDDFGDVDVPLLGYVVEEVKAISEEKVVASEELYEKEKPTISMGKALINVLELPLYLPRRLTIPVVSEENWSKPFAVISVTLAPILLAALWNSHTYNDMTRRACLVNFMAAALVGIFLGNLAFMTTNKSSPPNNCLLFWLAGGFVMSVTWTYMIAGELVSLLVSLGIVLGMSPSILGLTVLAWGNSVGDLVANVAMATSGGPVGAQIAVTGCYAGPMFNTLVGLGLSFVFSSSAQYPSPFLLPRDTSLYETLAFFMGGLLWALAVLPRKDMRVGRFLGGGLLAIYSCFLFLRLASVGGLSRP